MVSSQPMRRPADSPAELETMNRQAGPTPTNLLAKKLQAECVRGARIVEHVRDSLESRRLHAGLAFGDPSHFCFGRLGSPKESSPKPMLSRGFEAFLKDSSHGS